MSAPRRGMQSFQRPNLFPRNPTPGNQNQNLRQHFNPLLSNIQRQRFQPNNEGLFNKDLGQCFPPQRAPAQNVQASTLNRHPSTFHQIHRHDKPFQTGDNRFNHPHAIQMNQHMSNPDFRFDIENLHSTQMAVPSGNQPPPPKRQSDEQQFIQQFPMQTRNVMHQPATGSNIPQENNMGFVIHQSATGSNIQQENNMGFTREISHPNSAELNQMPHFHNPPPVPVKQTFLHSNRDHIRMESPSFQMHNQNIGQQMTGQQFPVIPRPQIPPHIQNQQPEANVNNLKQFQCTKHNMDQTEILSQDRVNGWLRAKGKTLNSKQLHQLRSKPELKICDVQSKMRKMMFLMAELQQQIKKMQSLGPCSEEDWSKETKKADDIKKELETLKTELQNKNTLEELQKQVDIRRKKRGRIKRKKRMEYEEKQHEMAEREELTRKIDEWRNKITREELRLKEEKELKSTADVILNEVRKKHADASKTVELLKGLQKLRSLRKGRLEHQGVVTKSDLNLQFEKEVTEQLLVMEKQQEIYAAEEKALRVMLETEHEETKVKDQEKSELEHKKEQDRMLFGQNESQQIDDSLYPFWQFYNQANINMDSLVQIRREWDAYLVPESTPGGSRIPDWWVVPSHPSNNIWATALQETK